MTARVTRRSDLPGRRPAFHLHTTYGDGALSVAESFAAARRAGYDALVFCEHVRRRPSYDPAAYAAAVRAESARTGLPAWVGFEAALDRDGSLDIGPEALAVADLVGLAEHRFPSDPVAYLAAMAGALQRYPDRPRVWLHPGMWFARRGALAAEFLTYRALLRIALAEGWLIEANRRHDLPPAAWRPLVPQGRLVEGLDAHAAADYLLPG